MPYLPHVLIFACCFVAILSGYLLYRNGRNSSHPIVDFGLLKEIDVVCTCLLNFGAAFTFHALLFDLPGYLVNVDGKTSTSAGLHLLPIAASASLGSLVSGLVVAKTGRYYLILVLAAILVVTGPVLYTLAAFLPLAPGFYNAIVAIGILPTSLGFQITSSLSIVLLLAAKTDRKISACTSIPTGKIVH